MAPALMLFYLGTHQPHWLADSEVPLFVSRVRLQQRKTFPRARTRWALDSGGFSQLAAPPFKWEMTAQEYAAQVNRFAAEIGLLDWAAPQDWMCEPHMLNGRTVAEHQRLTVKNFLELRQIETLAPIIPVLQGWTVDDYLRCRDLYENAGVDLTAEPTVGLGSVCRRQATGEAETIVMRLPDLRLHGFGMKTEGVHRYGDLLASADSLAWSFAGRKRGTCAHLKSRCANCLHWALDWRRNVLEPQRPTFFGV